MFEAAPDEDTDVDELVQRYLEELRTTLAAADANVADDLARAVERGAAGELTIEGAAGILAAGSDRLDDSAIEADLRDRILIEMSNAVVDVDTLASEMGLDRSGKELQQRIEGRAPMSLREYAAIRTAIAGRRR